jgi:hypothetical protein
MDRDSYILLFFLFVVILQPFKEDLPEDYKCKDKFLVQTAPINASFEQQDITSMVSTCWSNGRFFLIDFCIVEPC